MECRYLLICVFLAAFGGSYAYGYGRRGYGHGRGYGDPDHRFYGGIYHGYGHGGGYPPRDAYIHGAIYDHESDDHSSSEEEEKHEQEEHHDEDHKIWRFQVSDDYDAYAYIDEEGHAAGFLIDLLREVCDKAHKHCYFIVDTSTNCWRTDGERELPGIGLLDGYYDGCLGYWQSTARQNSFNFSLPFTRDVKASLHFKAGEKIENPTAVTGKKIGFVAGWPISKKCFEHQSGFTGNSPGKYEPVLFETHGSMVQALTSGQINAILTVDSYKDEPLGIQHSDPSFRCTEAGASVMTMYGSPLLEWWNHAFQDLKDDGTYRRLCQSSSRIHAAHGEINCL